MKRGASKVPANGFVLARSAKTAKRMALSDT